jgi:hypothetical protein
MRLKKTQKEALLKWIAEGLRSDEINERAGEFIPPFSVYPQHVDYYRRTRQADIEILSRAGEQDALSEGLALKSQRVKRLKQLAGLMEKDLFGGFLWLDQVKGVGSGEIAQIVDYEEFNKGEVDAYRGVLDDIAKELGGRSQRVEHSGPEGGPINLQSSGSLTIYEYGTETDSGA